MDNNYYKVVIDFEGINKSSKVTYWNVRAKNKAIAERIAIGELCISERGIKAFDGVLHSRLTGKDNALILENLQYLSEAGAKIEIRYPLVMGFNDTECTNIAKFISTLDITKVKVLQYHRYAGSRYEALGLKNTLPLTSTTFDDIENVIEILKSYGLNAVNGISS